MEDCTVTVTLTGGKLMVNGPDARTTCLVLAEALKIAMANGWPVEQPKIVPIGTMPELPAVDELAARRRLI